MLNPSAIKLPRRGANTTQRRWFLAIASLMLTTACFRIELGDGAGYRDGDFDVDTMVEEEIAAGNVADAANWLQEPGNLLFEGNVESVQELIDNLYAAGAYNVWFTGIEEFGNNNVSASIAAELPSDPSVRAEMLQIEADFWGGDPTPDKDQRFLSFYFD